MFGTVGLFEMFPLIAFIVSIGLIIAVFQMNSRLGKIETMQNEANEIASWDFTMKLVKEGNATRRLLSEFVKAGVLNVNNCQQVPASCTRQGSNPFVNFVNLIAV